MGGELSDLMSSPELAPNQEALNELIRHGQAGDRVTLVWHPANPTQGPFGTPISSTDRRNMVQDETAQYRPSPLVKASPATRERGQEALRPLS
jgi:hypothetical protein